MSKFRVLMDPEGGAGGGGAGGEGGTSGEPTVAEQIATAVEAATSGLKTNRDTILEEKRVLQEAGVTMKALIESVGGQEGMTKLAAFRANLEKDEMGKLLADGKHDEWFDQRTAALRGDFEQQLTAKDQQIVDLTEARDVAGRRLSDTLLKVDVDSAALAAGVDPSTLTDVRLVASQVFVYDPEVKKHVIKDESGVILLGKDGKTPKLIAEWMEEQKTERRYWWPESQGAGAGGGFGAGETSPSQAKIGQMSMSEYRAHREKQGMGTGYAGHVRSQT